MIEMLTALTKDNQLVIADKKLRKKDLYFCPACHNQVRLRRGKILLPHFAHRQNAACFALLENESERHLVGKLAILNFFKGANLEGDLEVYFPAIQQRPDVLLTNGQHQTAIEFQCSPLSAERHKQRNKGYQSLKIPVIWILGEPYLERKLTGDKIAQFAYFRKNLGIYLLYWRSKLQVLEVHYQLKIDCSQKIYYQVMQFSTYYDYAKWLSSAQISVGASKGNLSVYRKLMKQIQTGIFYNSTNYRSWQNYCYVRGSSLMQIPRWLFQDLQMKPLFRQSNIIWEKLVIVTIQADYHNELLPKDYLNICRRITDLLGGPYNFLQIPNAEKWYDEFYKKFYMMLIQNLMLKIKNKSAM